MRFSCFVVTNVEDDNEQPFLDSTGCNKMIMIVTDGATETALNVFQSRNWIPDNISTCHSIEVNTIRSSRVFSNDFFSLDTSIYLYDWQRTWRSQTYPLDVLCK